MSSRTDDRLTAIPGGHPSPRVSPRLVRRIVLVVFVVGIGGMIAGSIMDTNGFAITFGLLTAVAALALVLVTSVSPPEALSGASAAPVVDERLAADVEARIAELVAAGADEDTVRRLVGRAVEMGRGA